MDPKEFMLSLVDENPGITKSNLVKMLKDRYIESGLGSINLYHADKTVTEAIESEEIIVKEEEIKSVLSSEGCVIEKCYPK